MSIGQAYSDILTPHEQQALTEACDWLLGPSVRKKLSHERESVSSIVADRGATRVQFENVDRCLYGCEEIYASSSRRSS